MVSISDCLVSFVDGRVRLRHPALKSAETSGMISAVVGGVDGVIEVRSNPVTGSLLIFYDTERLSREKLLELAEQGTALLPAEPECRRESLSRTCARALLSRRATRLVDRALFVSLLCSLAGAATGMGAVHRITGAVFAVASLQHMAAHRKALW